MTAGRDPHNSKRKGMIMIITEIPKSWAHLDRIKSLEADLHSMTAAKDHIGSSLAAVTAERDTLRREHNGCALWAEGSRRERDRLKVKLAAMTAACNELKTALCKIAALDYRNAATNGCAYAAHALAQQALVNARSRAEAEGGRL